MATVAPLDHVWYSMLSGVPWSTYLELRALPENYHVRMTYDDGELELMSPSQRHEKFAHFIGRLIDAYTLAQGIEIAACRTTTFQRADLKQGWEPDNCYYIANEAQVRGKIELDLTIDPAPDLVIEVALDRRPRKKLQLYAAFRVSEVWVFNGEKLDVLFLSSAGRYDPAAASRSLPGLLPNVVEQYLARLWREPENALIREFTDSILKNP